MSIDKETVLAALARVQDPELKKSLVDLGMIHDIEIAGSAVKVTVALTMAGCPLKERLKEDVRSAVAAIEGVTEVKVVLTVMTSEERARIFGREPEEMEGIKEVRNIIAIGSGKGGVGKTTVTVNLAVALHQKGFSVGILDADMHGPDIPIMLGISGRPLGSGGMLLPLERHGIKVMSTGVLAGEGTPIVWRGPLVNKAIKEFLGHVLWGKLDFLLVDLPPGTGDAAITVANAIPLAGVVIVTTPQKVSVSDVRRSIGLFHSKDIPILGIIENMGSMRIRTPDGEIMTIDVFGSGGGEKIAKAFKVPFLGCIPLDPSIREGGDAGRPPSLDLESDVFRAFHQIVENIMQNPKIKKAT